MSQAKPKRTRKPLGITCKSTSCQQNLHCFLPAPKNRTRSAAAMISLFEDVPGEAALASPGTFKAGLCWQCGADLVDWSRVHKRELADVAYTFQSLKYELFRHHYWHTEIDLRAENHARRKGMVGMREAVERRIRKYVCSGVAADDLTFDGRQTPLEGNVIFYAQHATASCCRKCMEVWHKIPRHHDLTEEQITYFTNIIMLYIAERLPNLAEHGEKVAPIRRKALRAGTTKEVA